MWTTDTSPRLLDSWLTSQVENTSQYPDIGFIECLYQTCSLILTHLWKSRLRFISRGPHKNTLGKDVLNIRLLEESFPVGHFDTTLGDSSPLKVNLVENLKAIGDILIWYFLGFDEDSANSQVDDASIKDLVQELRSLLEKAEIFLSVQPISDATEDWDSSDDSASTTDNDLSRHGRLHCYVTCLMDLIPVLQRQAFFIEQNVELQPLLPTNICLSPTAQPFVMRIRDKFIDAPTPLVEKLAQASWERLIRIRVQDEEGPSVRDSRWDEDTYASQYATRTVSRSRYLFIDEGHDQTRPHPSHLPSEEGFCFECEYCGKTLPMRDWNELRLHIFADLQPYMCTHTECKHACGVETFTTRQAWANHEINEHFAETHWRCDICNSSFLVLDNFERHLTKVHKIAPSGGQWGRIIYKAKESDLKDNFKEYKCPLCSQNDWHDTKDYEIHVGRHLEEISLACLGKVDDWNLALLNEDESTNEIKNSVDIKQQSSNRDTRTGSQTLGQSAKEPTGEQTYNAPTEQPKYYAHSSRDKPPGRGTIQPSPEYFEEGHIKTPPPPPPAQRIRIPPHIYQPHKSKRPEAQKNHTTTAAVSSQHHLLELDYSRRRVSLEVVSPEESYSQSLYSSKRSGSYHETPRGDRVSVENSGRRRRPEIFYFDEDPENSDPVEEYVEEAEKYQTTTAGYSTAQIPVSQETLLPQVGSGIGSDNGSQKNRSNSSRGSATKTEKGKQNMTLTMDGMTVGFAEEGLAGKSINIRTGEKGARQFNITDSFTRRAKAQSPSVTNDYQPPDADADADADVSPGHPNHTVTSGLEPSPLRATTPLVVRQDSNGVQWIAFEYFRDRVRMEYTIRCDVESVDVESLSHSFKIENCVYPRAYPLTEPYRGNLLAYETSCNTFGWALAELNSALRGNRGLIQRAVDSWWNSDQDPWLRSRQVDRQAKISARQTTTLPPAGGPLRRSAIETQSAPKELPPYAPVGLSVPLMATHEWPVTRKEKGPTSEGLVDDNSRAAEDTTQRGPTER
ncbi:hypothetical protein N7490_003535 [Penicillium lividum]|nr:hypothetical protein N7490_003535 [Penicillium lividum]